jgi:hypothetical protein
VSEHHDLAGITQTVRPFKIGDATPTKCAVEIGRYRTNQLEVPVDLDIQIRQTSFI